MNIITILLWCLSIIIFVLAAPIDDSQNAHIIKSDFDNIGVDGYRFSYETSDGISREEEGQLKNPGTEQEAISVRGSVSWIGDDGQIYTINYVADENGYRPDGAHLPQT